MGRFLVTGANGFIGRALCEYLQAQGDEIVALLHTPAEGLWKKRFCCELGSQPLPHRLMEGVDSVFHLANLAHADPLAQRAEKYWQVNVTGTEALLEAARQANVRSFVYFSSVKAVGDPGSHCVDEEWDAMPLDPYGLSKREAEERVLATGRVSGMHVCNLRPALVYGPRVQGNLYHMLYAISRRRFPPLPEFGNRRSMVSLEDVVSAAWLAAVNPQANGKTYIVSDNVEYSSRRLYELMCEALGIGVPKWRVPAVVFRFGAILGDSLFKVSRRRVPLNSAVLSRLAGSACYRSKLIQKELGWRPEKNFPDILSEMVEHVYRLEPPGGRGFLG